MVIKRFFKEQKGILVSDAVIAILIIMLFVGIITSVISNIVLESLKIKASSQQIDYATEVLEYIDKSSYATVTLENIVSYINTKNSEHVSAGATTDNLTTPYKVAISVEKYNETDGNEDKLDIVKVVKVLVETDIRGKVYSTEISTVKKASIQEIERLLQEI